MKRSSSLFALLLFALLYALAVPVAAQTIRKPPKLVNRAEQDKREVKRFVRSFLKVLDETKDLDEVPRDFFVKDFKDHQNLLLDDLFGAGPPFKQLSLDERYKLQTEFLNIAYLGVVWMSDRFMSEDDDGDSDDDDSLEKRFPPDVVAALKQSRLGLIMFDNEAVSDEDSITPADLLEMTTVFENAASLLRIALDSRDIQRKTLSAKNLRAVRKKIEDYGSKPCEKGLCSGLPEKTPVFWQSAFPLCLHLTREDGRLKVFYIHVYTND